MTITFPCDLPEYTSLVGTCSKTCDYMKALMIPIRSCNVMKGDPTIDGVNIPNPFIRITPNISEMNGKAYIKKDSKLYYLDSITLFYTPMHGFVDNTDMSSELQLFFKFNQEYVIISVPVQSGSSGTSVPFFASIIKSIKNLEKSLDSQRIDLDSVDTSTSNIQVQDLIPTSDDFYYYEPTVYDDQFGDDDTYTPVNPPKTVYVYTSPIYIDSESMNYIRGQTVKEYKHHSISYDSIFFHEHKDSSISVQSGALAGTVPLGDDIYIDCGNTDYDDRTIGTQPKKAGVTYYIILLSILLVLYPIIYMILKYFENNTQTIMYVMNIILIVFNIVYVIIFATSKQIKTTASIVNFMILVVCIMIFLTIFFKESNSDE